MMSAEPSADTTEEIAIVRLLMSSLCRDTNEQRQPAPGASPLPVSRKYVVFGLYFRVAGEPALGVIRLRRLVT